MFWMIVGSIIASLAGLGVYIYCLKRGQFEDSELVKYQIFQDENPEDY